VAQSIASQTSGTIAQSRARLSLLFHVVADLQVGSRGAGALAEPDI
jgi:hypothetical protein